MDEEITALEAKLTELVNAVSSLGMKIMKLNLLLKNYRRKTEF